MKKTYETPSLCITEIKSEDIITVSGLKTGLSENQNSFGTTYTASQLF